jgi:hypothetical protein
MVLCIIFTIHGNVCNFLKRLKSSIAPNYLRMRTLILQLLLILLCTEMKDNQLWASQNTLQLKVGLYPYLPDSCQDEFEAFENRIEQEFEGLYPHIDLILRPLNQTGSFYDYPYLENLLNEYDILETDSIYLGRLIHEGLITPWAQNPCESVAWQAMPQQLCEETNHHSWPHWQCGYFLFGQPQNLTGVHDLGSFEARLNQVPESKIPLIINLYGKANLSNIYMDALTDQSSAVHPDRETNATLATTLSAIETLANYTCTPKGYNPAIQGLYNQHPKIGSLLFAEQKALYYIGYAEDYASIKAFLPNQTLPIAAIHAPWGPFHNPTLAVDSLVLSKKSPQEAQAAALLFAQYLTHPSTYQWMVLGEDCPHQAKGRYLLPASMSAYTESKIGETPVMLDYYKAIQNGANVMPWKSYALVYQAMGNGIYTLLNNTVHCTTL